MEMENKTKIMVIRRNKHMEKETKKMWEEGSRRNKHKENSMMKEIIGEVHYIYDEITSNKEAG